MASNFPSHSMAHYVISICFTCHVYTSSGHKPNEMFSTAVFCLQTILNVYCEFRVISLLSAGKVTGKGNIQMTLSCAYVYTIRKWHPVQWTAAANCDKGKFEVVRH